MPNYDFACTSCGTHLEINFPLESYDAIKDGIPCPDCKGTAIKVFSAPGFTIKTTAPHLRGH